MPRQFAFLKLLGLFALLAQFGFAHNTMALRMQDETVRLVLCTGDGPLVVWLDESGAPETDRKDQPQNKGDQHDPCLRLIVTAFDLGALAELPPRGLELFQQPFALEEQSEIAFRLARHGLTRAPPASV